MESITVDRNKLVDILKENRDTHEKVYKDAVKGYRKRVIKGLKKTLKKAEGGGEIVLNKVVLPKPSNNLDSYDSAISLLELAEDDKIQLSPEDHESFVRDNWQWTQNFLAGSSSYASKSVTANYGNKMRR